MTIAYIAHPIGGDVKNNLEKIRLICREINLNEPDVVPFVPYYLDCHALDDNVLPERERGIKNNVELIKRGFIDEIRLYGHCLSNGMKQEVLLGWELDIKVRPMTESCHSDLFKFHHETFPDLNY